MVPDSQGRSIISSGSYLRSSWAISEEKTLAERFEQRVYCADLHRLRGLFLATLGADETQIEALFQEAIRIAREQKSVLLEKRGQATYTEYRRQKASASGGCNSWTCLSRCDFPAQAIPETSITKSLDARM
jgi:hypothetical protein